MSTLRPNRRKDRNADPEAKAFMGWVRSLACIVCWLERFTWDRFWDLARKIPRGGMDPPRNPTGFTTEFAHIGGGMAAKASNWSGIPLCGWHHSEAPDAQEKLKRKFFEYHSIDGDAFMSRLKEEFLKKEGIESE